MKINTKLKAIIVIALITASLVGAVAAVGYIMTSQPKTVTVTEQATLTIDSSAATIVVGESVTLTATCTDATFAGLVTFKAGSTTIGTATASGGIATFQWTPAIAGTYSVTATATHS